MLKFALKLDGVASIGIGLLMLVLRPALGFPTAFLIGVGAVAVAYGCFAFWLGTRELPDRKLVQLVLAFNALWVADSVLVAEVGWFPLSTLGVVLTLAQAVGVVGFLVLQVMGARATYGSALGTPRRSQHPVAP
ncbi:hypothetical protein FKR81_06305 [Lentzea tibetensis]|uniref:Integral membrane protein n=1 Tax=Lentzea tibetensis TaxID=2591470 RepID=A0A563F0X2_9PSEU|nr:hypothetical protein [Lentzea tibetensis]TWP53559.1 hypothetical protein FKR81_06305 [Lentzea tibetensis]